MSERKIPTPLEIFEALVAESKGDDFAVYNLRLPMYKSTGWHECPLCGYTSSVTNIHRHCPLAPINLDDEERGGLYGRTMSIQMIPCEAPSDGNDKLGNNLPDWEDRQWEWHTDPKEWEETVRKYLKKVAKRG